MRVSASVDSPIVSSVSTEMSVLVVEEHALVRTALRTLIDATPGLRVVAESRGGAVALDLARVHQPDVVLIDARMRESADLSFIAAFRRAAPAACLLLLSQDEEGSGALDRAGIHGCLPMDAGVPELCAAVAAVLGGRCSNCAFHRQCPVPLLAVALSRRERQVAIRVAEGRRSKEIAAALGISLSTVNTYRESLARKLGASSAAVVTRFVLESGLTDTVPSPEMRADR